VIENANAFKNYLLKEGHIDSFDIFSDHKPTFRDDDYALYYYSCIKVYDNKIFCVDKTNKYDNRIFVYDLRGKFITSWTGLNTNANTIVDNNHYFLKNDDTIHIHYNNTTDIAKYYRVREVIDMTFHNGHVYVLSDFNSLLASSPDWPNQKPSFAMNIDSIMKVYDLNGNFINVWSKFSDLNYIEYDDSNENPKKPKHKNIFTHNNKFYIYTQYTHHKIGQTVKNFISIHQ
jgi:hypothetical protein